MGDLIQIEAKDCSKVELVAEDSVRADLSDAFTFLVPGYQYMPRYKAKLWDGKIRVINRYDRYVPAGLVPKIRQHAVSNGVEFKCSKEVASLFVSDSYREEEVQCWLDGLTLTDERGQDMEIHDYQEKAVHSCLRDNRSIIESPTSSGKSLIIYCLTRWYLEKQNVSGAVLIIVPTIQLVRQMATDIQTYGLSDPVSPSFMGKVHQIMGGEEKVSDLPVQVSTWQSIYKMPPEWFEKFSVVMVDEVHLAKGESIQGIMKSCSNVRFRHGFTGTLDDAKANRLVIESLFGPPRKFVSSSELMERGVAAKLKIQNVILRYGDKDRDLSRLLDYQREVEFLVHHAVRTSAIRELVETKMPGNSLILVNLKEHAKILGDELAKAKGKRVFVRTGDNSLDERLEVKSAMEGGNDVVFVATYGIMSTGVSVRRINHLVFASPSKERKRVLQSIGRVLRLADDKDSATLWDLADDLSTTKPRKRLNFAMRHFMERVKLYDREKFSYSTTSLEL